MADEVKEPAPKVEPEEKVSYEIDGDLVPTDEPKPKKAKAAAVEDDEDDEPLDLPTKEEEPKPEPAAEKKPASLVRLARSLGVTEARISSLSNDRLDELCDTLMESRDAEIANAAKRKAEPAAEDEEDDDDAVLKSLVEEEFDPRIVKLLEKSVKKTKAIEAERKSEKEEAKRKHYEAMVKEADDAFVEINSALLGGSTSGLAMQQDAAEMTRRNLLIRDSLENPIKGMSLKQRIKHAAKTLLGVTENEVPSGPAPKPKVKNRPTEEQWSQAEVAVPNGRRIPEDRSTGRQAAVEAVDRKIRDNKALETSLEVNVDIDADGDLPM